MAIKKISVETLDRLKHTQPAEYIAALYRRGTVVEGFLSINEDDLKAIAPLAKKPPQKIRGLGDIVAKVAQPIAGVIDRVAGTNLKECRRCKKRQEKLNKAFPLS